MNVGSHGYVKSSDYKQNSDGTFACKVIKLHNGSAIDNTCIGILNENNIKSPNNYDQMMIMSEDNKYIFLPVSSNTFLHMIIMLFTL